MPDRILVVDDDTSIAAALGIRLRAMGFDVTTANRGEDGLAAASEADFDVILLDIRMPDLDGFEVAQRLSETTRHAETPIVFISANVVDQARQRAYTLGASAFLTKPYDAREVVETVKRIITTGERRVASAPKGVAS